MGGRTYGTWELVGGLDASAGPGRCRRHGVERHVDPAAHARGGPVGDLLLHDHGRPPWSSPTNTRTLDPVDVWQTVERERINGLSVVGDAMARPLIEELERGHYDTSGFMAFGSGGAMLSEGMKTRILAELPTILIIRRGRGLGDRRPDGHQRPPSGSVSTGRFVPGPGATVVSEDLTPRARGRATRSWAGWPRRARSPSATWATPRRRPAPSR